MGGGLDLAEVHAVRVGIRTTGFPADADRTIAEVAAGHATGKIVIEPTPVC